MKIELTDYQQSAVTQLVKQVRDASGSVDNTKHAFVLSAPTGSGKTAIVTAVMERLMVGDDSEEGEPETTFLWVTDAPELNEQTRKKILGSSEVFTADHIVTVDASFDRPEFDVGKIYFLNTQKLGQATTFTRTGDERTYTIWDTIARTSRKRPRKFFLILDEAHKGIGRHLVEVREAATIVRRLIVGDAELAAPSLVIGVSATPGRFNELLERATDRVRWPTHVSPEDVRESGLIKDEIILWHTKKNGKSGWALLRQAAGKLKEYEEAWTALSKREDQDPVRPILVIQVADGTGRKISNTNLGEVLGHIEEVFGSLPDNSVVHCFQDAGTIEFSSERKVRKIQPSDIQDDETVRVVFFKMALNTGWDCPRAEVMMSFRRAVDHTLIAQLVGRMVRTPGAQRVLSDPFLNSVSLYLPNWDDEALNRVIEHLTSSADAVPTTVTRAENRTHYVRAPRSKILFDAAALLPTYPTKRVNKDSNVKRLMQLARYLANDEIMDDALDSARNLLLGVLDANRLRLKSRMKKLVEAIQKVDLVESRIAIGTPFESSDVEERDAATTARSIDLLEQDIRALFADAGRRLGAGLHIDYLDARISKERKRPTATIARAELCALIGNKETQEMLEKVAGAKIKEWWRQTHSNRQKLSPERRADYARVNRMALAPEPESLDLPLRLTMTKGPTPWKKHIYVDENGEFYPSPPSNRWEQLTIEREMQSKGFRGWFRNPVRKDWSLGVPYDEAGITAVMYPDFLVFRSAGKQGIIVDILEPHAPNQGDLAPKLQGLCKFADMHGDMFGRIELILVEGDKGKERLLPIDVNNPDIRDDAKLLTERKQVIALALKLDRA